MLNSPITLPCGTTLKNRLVKPAMTERMSNSKGEPTEAHERLYSLWADTGAGLLITGNVMIDRRHMESGGNVCFDDERMIPKLRKWAEAGKRNNTGHWVQISHAGRQTSKFWNTRPLAPSSVQLRKMGLFGKPRAMAEADILEVIDGFRRAAVISCKAGFTGLQVHSAHGYLLSQFLSPLTNQRTDKWGGSIENRSRLLLEIIDNVRKEVGSDFPVAVKLNSADFQHGGFTNEESLKVVQMLDKVGIDLLEISGGTYEQIVFLQGDRIKESTKVREAYFIDFARKVRQVTTVPLMVTGGFRSRAFSNEVIASGEIDLVGLARPFITNSSDIGSFLSGGLDQLADISVRTGWRQLEDSAEGGYYGRQLIRLAKGKPLDKAVRPLWSAIWLLTHEISKAIVKRIAGHNQD